MFSEEDQLELKKLGARVLNNHQVRVYMFDGDEFTHSRCPEQHVHILEKLTVVFMPFCYIDLHEALLKTNWEPCHLTNYIMIGNLLDDFVLK